MGGLAGRPDVEATALGTEIEFLTGWLVFGSDAVGDYSDDACAGFYAPAHQCLFCFADKGGYEDSLCPYRFFPSPFISLSFFFCISAAYYGGGYDRMLQQLEIAVEVHLPVDDFDEMGTVEEFGMGHYGQSAAGIVGDVMGESLGHCVAEGDLVVEFWGEEGYVL